MSNEPHEPREEPGPQEPAGTQAAGPAAESPASPATPAPAAPTAVVDVGEVEQLLREALDGYEEILATVDAATAPGAVRRDPGDRVEPMPPMGADLVDQNLDLLRDVHLQVKVELGRGRMHLKDILRLGQGSVVELERLAGDPLDIYVNDKVIARGEVLVLNESFCIRITEVFHRELPAQAT